MMSARAKAGMRRRKKRSQLKKHKSAPLIKCACGCNVTIKSIDKYGRPKQFVSGHNGRKYDDPKEYKRASLRKRKAADPKLSSRYKMKRHRKLKARLLFEFGGKCVECGMAYNGKNAAVFHFHHPPGVIKLFNVGHELINKAWDTIIAEAKKCLLICANCHELKHSKEF